MNKYSIRGGRRRAKRLKWRRRGNLGLEDLEPVALDAARVGRSRKNHKTQLCSEVEGATSDDLRGIEEAEGREEAVVEDRPRALADLFAEALVVLAGSDASEIFGDEFVGMVDGEVETDVLGAK